MNPFIVSVLVVLCSASCAGQTVSPDLPQYAEIHIITTRVILSTRTDTLANSDLVFRDASGSRWRFVTDVNDPEISNHGDGAFHPADSLVVRHALDAIPIAFTRELRLDIYLLPFPRSGQLSSSADDRAIYITPGVYAYREENVHFLVAHEIGHAIHRRFLPDDDRAGWREWAFVRGVSDTTVYHAEASHAYRPHEIFAEDIRVLFGGTVARGSGSVENPNIVLPEQVRGLRTWYLTLVGEPRR